MHFAVRLFVLALLLFLTIPRLAQRGMYGDGLVHAVVARNMSIGVGSLWAPSFTTTAYPQFLEQPPLGLALQAVAFLLLGDHLYVERVFQFSAFALHALVIALIWRRVQPSACDWLPVLFWVVPSITTWAVINNMLETPQALLTSTAVLLLIGGTGDSVTRAGAIARGMGGGLAIAAAVLTKGPVGFFPLIAPVLFLLLPESRRPGRLLLRTGAMIVMIATVAASLAAYEPSRRGLDVYLDTQLSPALRGDRDVNEERVPIVRHVVIGIAARMSALLALIAFAGRRPLGGEAVVHDAVVRDAASDRVAGFTRPEHVAVAFCFLGLALCASTPIAFSPKLAGHYFVPSVPMFALGFASLARPFTERMIAAWARKPSCRPAVLGMAAAVAAASVLVPVLHGPMSKRDSVLVRDLETIGAAMPRDLTIGSCQHPRAKLDWCINSYVQRWYRVSLDARDAPVNGWLLQTDDEACRAEQPRGGEGAGWQRSCAPPSECTAVASSHRLTLFRCP
jgi:4-amino-4-deoxy-L-arabinose transferase-like glycosyltransferase